MFPILLPLPAEQFITISKDLSASRYSTRRVCFQRSASLHTTVRKVYWWGLELCFGGAKPTKAEVAGVTFSDSDSAPVP